MKLFTSLVMLCLASVGVVYAKPPKNWAPLGPRLTCGAHVLQVEERCVPAMHKYSTICDTRRLLVDGKPVPDVPKKKLALENGLLIYELTCIDANFGYFMAGNTGNCDGCEDGDFVDLQTARRARKDPPWFKGFYGHKYKNVSFPGPDDE